MVKCAILEILKEVTVNDGPEDRGTRNLIKLRSIPL